MIISLWGYAIQISTLFIAVSITDSLTTQWSVAILGSIIAGFTSAVWWTAQGIYFEHICKQVLKCLQPSHLYL